MPAESLYSNVALAREPGRNVWSRVLTPVAGVVTVGVPFTPRWNSSISSDGEMPVEKEPVTWKGPLRTPTTLARVPVWARMGSASTAGLKVTASRYIRRVMVVIAVPGVTSRAARSSVR